MVCADKSGIQRFKMRGSSVHFKRISSAIHAVSHASREVPPEYLLPPDLSLGTHVVIDDHGQVQKLLEHKMNLASRQAKATKDYSPMWEGVINLPDPADATPQQQIEIVKDWCVAYEKMTGHKVIRADVHLDEGFVDESGKAVFNAHAHVMCDRTDAKGKVMKLTSTVLRTVQTMTAEVTTLQRGLDARETGRKHVGHQNFRFDAEKNRVGLDKVKTNATFLEKLVDSQIVNSKESRAKLKTSEATISTQSTDISTLRQRLADAYKARRKALKDSGTAKQKDYQDLKKENEAALEALEKELEAKGEALAKAQAEAGKVPGLEAQATVLAKALESEKEAHTATYNQALKIQDGRDKLKEKVKAMTQEKMTLEQANATLTEQAKKRVEHPRPSAADLQKIEAALDFKARFANMARDYEAHKAAGKDPALFMPATEAEYHSRMAQPLLDKAKAIRAQVASGEKSDTLLVTAVGHELAAAKIAKIAAEAPKPQTQPTSSPTHEKSLRERLAASLRVILEWIKSKGGEFDPVDQNDEARSEHYYGPVVQVHDLHAVQKTGRSKFTVHQLAKLNAVPALDDPKTEICYRGGVGLVKGKVVGQEPDPSDNKGNGPGGW